MANRVFLVEDHEDMRLLYRRMLTRQGVVVCGEAPTAEQALRQIPDSCADLVLVDISLPGMDGLELVRRLRGAFPLLCLLICTGHDVSRFEETAQEAGADGIVSKEDGLAMLATVKDFLQNHCGPIG